MQPPSVPYAVEAVHPNPVSPTAAAPRAGVRRCPGCDTYAYVTTDVCPECGEELQLQPKIIRCRRCGQHANSELMICPHCARDLQPAPSRMWTVGAPALLVLLFGLVFVSRLSGFSLASNALNGAGLTLAGANGDPNLSEVIVMTPVPAEQDAAVVASEEAVLVEAEQPETAAKAEESIEAASAPETIEVQDQVVEVEAAEVEPAQVEAVTDTPDDEPDTNAAMVEAAAAEEEPDARAIGGPAADSPVTEAESTPDIVATALEDVGEPDAQASENSAPASDEPDAENQDAEDLVVQAAALSLVDAPDEAEPANETVDNVAENTDTAAGVMIEYEVQAGDTIIGIAFRHGTTVDEILRLNNMTERDALRIRAGDLLAVTDERVSQRTVATAENSTGNDAPGEDGDFRLTPPMLRNPADGTILSCGAAEKLTWFPVPYMEAGDSYVLHLGFVAGRTPDGDEQITWVLAQPRPANITSWELDRTLCSLAPAEYGRQWRWWVEATHEQNGAMESISPPSEIWGFSWN
jgi:LysM repeat protein